MPEAKQKQTSFVKHLSAFSPRKPHLRLPGLHLFFHFSPVPYLVGRSVTTFQVWAWPLESDDVLKRPPPPRCYLHRHGCRYAFWSGKEGGAFGMTFLTSQAMSW